VKVLAEFFFTVNSPVVHVAEKKSAMQTRNIGQGY
jgi:hypothetical protein